MKVRFLRIDGIYFKPARSRKSAGDCPRQKILDVAENTSNPNFPKTTLTWTLEPVGDDGSKTKVTLAHT